MIENKKLDEDLQGKQVDATLYRGMIGSLMYLTTSRPDLNYANEEYDIWAMEIEHYLEYIDNDVWKELTSTSKSSVSAQNVAFVSHSKSSTNKVKSGHTGAYSTYTHSTSPNNIPEREAPAGFADEVIYSPFAKQYEDLDLLHEDLEQLKILMKPVGFDKKKLECFKCHNTGHFAREYPSNGINNGKKRDSFYQDQGARKKEHNQNCLLTMDDGLKTLCDEQMNQLGEQEAKILAYTQAVKKLEAQIVTFQKQQLSLNEQLTFQANELYEKDEKLKKYKRIRMKAVKEKEQLQKTVDSWKDSSKNLWKLVNSGIK
ncbi:hypothetical protein Tco_0273532 [Tanacetum coccineum]